jgi:hypothetical protein
MKAKTIGLLIIGLLGTTQLFSAQSKKQTGSIPQIQSKQDAEQYLDGLSNLPNDIQLIIFDYLISANSLEKLNKDIAHYSGISKRFNLIAKSAVGREKICQARITFIQKDLNFIPTSCNPEKCTLNQLLHATNQKGDTMLLSLLRGRHWIIEGRSMNTSIYQQIMSLIDCGANINQVNAISEATALMLAVSDSDLVKMLLLNGAKISINLKDINGLTALMYATRNAPYGHDKASVIALIGAGANLNLQDKFGRTALMYAASKGHAYTVENLIDAGARVSELRDVENKTALDIAEKEYKFNARKKNYLSIINMLKTQIKKEEYDRYHPMTII